VCSNGRPPAPSHTSWALRQGLQVVLVRSPWSSKFGVTDREAAICDARPRRPHIKSVFCFALKRLFRRSITFEWIWQTRLSVRANISPISRIVWPTW
jgi:hypothetical protein